MLQVVDICLLFTKVEPYVHTIYGVEEELGSAQATSHKYFCAQGGSSRFI